MFQSLEIALNERDDLRNKVCQHKSDVEAQEKLMENEMEKLVEQSHCHFEVLEHDNCAKYYLYGW